MLKHTAFAIVLGMGLAATAAAQSSGKPAPTITINDLSAPTSPAFVLLGVSPAAVDRPETPKAFTLSLLSKVATANGLPRNYALEVAPYWLTSHPGLTFGDYQNPNVWQSIRQSFSLTLGTAPIPGAAPSADPTGTRIGLAFRVAIVNGRAHPRLQSLVQQLETSDDIRFDLMDKEDELLEALKKDPTSKTLNDELARVQKQIAGERAKTAPVALQIQGLDAERVGFFLHVAAGQVWNVPGDDLDQSTRGKRGLWLTPSYRWRRCGAAESCESSFDIIAVARALTEPDKDAVWDYGGRVVWKVNQELMASIEALRRHDTAATPADKTSSNRTVGLIEYRIRQDLILYGSFGRDFKEITGTKPLVSFLGLNIGFGDKPVVEAKTSKSTGGQK